MRKAGASAVPIGGAAALYSLPHCQSHHPNVLGIACQGGVIRDQNKRLGDALRDQQTVEGIAMNRG
jgi:hypothetical protein